MTLRIRSMLRWAFFALPFQIRQCRRDFADDYRLRHHPVRAVCRQIRSRQLRVLQTHRDMKPV
jgi:hypothetical protein